MGFPRIFKLPQNNRFEYKPLYYDKKKEALEKKKKFYADLKEKKENGEYVSDIKGKFSKKNVRSTFSKENKISNIRLYTIVFVFGFLAYLLIRKWDLISYMFNILTKK